MMAIFRIGWIALRELLFEKIFYVFAAIALASLGASALLGQLTYAEQSKLTLDFMLGATEISMVLFSVFMGISLFHRELSQGSIYMVLSKPVSRTSFLLGKYFGQLAAQALVMILMGCVAYAVVSRFPENLSAVATLQALLLIFFEMCVVSAMTFFFAVNAGAVTAAIATLGLFVFGHLGNAIEEGLKRSGDQIFWKVVQAAAPNLDLFNVGSSRVDLQACKLEYSIVSPK